MSIKPTVGMGATICYYSDRRAATVIKVSKTGHKVTVQEDTATRTDNNGMSDSQTYEYTRNPSGREHVFFRNKDGTYGSRRDGKYLWLGERSEYFDYGF